MNRIIYLLLFFLNFSGVFAQEVFNPESFVQNALTKEKPEQLVTVDQDLQNWVQNKLESYRLPYAAVVGVNPGSGEIEVVASHSRYGSNYDELTTKALFPAASLFKIVTAAAAIEVADLDIGKSIRYRGGQYTLNKYNFKPHKRKDNKSIKFDLAMAKSTNPAFARVALNHLSLGDLEQYAMKFGLGSAIPFDGKVGAGEVFLPATEYDMARAAAGFGRVKISPLHAALVIAGLQNEGVIMRPYLRASGQPMPFQQAVTVETAEKLKNMLALTTKSGTARRRFRSLHKKYGPELKIYSKTGTLNGLEPKGTNFWFAGGLEYKGRKLALAVLVVDEGTARVRAVPLAKEITQFWLNQ